MTCFSIAKTWVKKHINHYLNDIINTNNIYHNYHFFLAFHHNKYDFMICLVDNKRINLSMLNSLVCVFYNIQRFATITFVIVRT